MCGIVGVLDGTWGGEGTEVLLPRVRAAAASLAHRGPDGEGFLVVSPEEAAAFILDREGRRTDLGALGASGHEHRRGSPASGTAQPSGEGLAPFVLVAGHRRLAIIDPTEAGRQPMATPDGRFVILLNGEIYNHVELRRELEAGGHLFRSRSDTEVLLTAWAAWGEACLGRLTGMFAFALLDRTGSRLILARDPFGMKPLYLCREGRRLLFASEIPPLLALSSAGRRADPKRLLDYLNDGRTDHGASTMFEGIEQLPAAHLLEVPLGDPRRAQAREYWRLDLRRRAEIGFEEAARALRDLFAESVAMHLRSDARVGTMLSGGIDSSAIVMAMREAGGRALELHTFSYIAGQGAPSEEPWIDRVNEAAGAVAHKVRLSPADLPVHLDDLVAAQGEPFGSLAVYAQSRVFAEAAAQGVKVILDGQGADEILGGYASVLPDHLAGLLRSLRWGEALGQLRGIGRRQGGSAPAPSMVKGPALQLLAPSAVVRAVLPRLLPGVAWRTARRIAGRDLRPWVSRAWCARHGIVPSDWPPPAGASPLQAALWRSVRLTSLPALLRYEDRSSMARSVEARLPFLTPRLASFALSLPAGHLIGPDGTGKSVLRAALKGLVPDAVLQRREKVGFAVPNRTWITLVPGMADLLDEAGRIPAVEPGPVAEISGAMRAGRPLSEGTAALAWRLAGLALWVRRFGVGID